MTNELRHHIQATRLAQAKRHSETRFADLNVTLGPLAAALRDEAEWLSHDHLYPAWQVYADEIERILQFADIQGQIGRYWPRLIARVPQRDSALDELRVAYFLDSCGLRIAEWEPPGMDQKKGEFLVLAPSGARVFVEVKGPRWEGELKKGEIRAGRTMQPKDLYLETRAVAPWKQIQFEVDKAYDKFLPTTNNLLVVIGHRGFISLEHGTAMHASQALYERSHTGCFTTAKYANIGGSGVFWMANATKERRYKM